jgi:polyhydroxyalkanoate synthesis regulator phasin
MFSWERDGTVSLESLVNKTSQILNEIIDDLELQASTFGALEKILLLTVSKDALEIARQSAANDVKRHFEYLRAQVAALPEKP